MKITFMVALVTSTFILTACTLPPKPVEAPVAPTADLPPTAPPVMQAPVPQSPRAMAAVSQPRVLRRVDPRYPPQLMEEGVEGRVQAQFVVDAQGVPGEVTIVHASHPLFAKAVRDTVRAWRFEPARDAQGTPLRARVAMPFQFKLQ